MNFYKHTVNREKYKTAEGPGWSPGLTLRHPGYCYKKPDGF